MSNIISHLFGYKLMCTSAGVRHNKLFTKGSFSKSNCLRCEKSQSFPIRMSCLGIATQTLSEYLSLWHPFQGDMTTCLWGLINFIARCWCCCWSDSKRCEFFQCSHRCSFSKQSNWVTLRCKFKQLSEKPKFLFSFVSVVFGLSSWMWISMFCLARSSKPSHELCMRIIVFLTVLNSQINFLI